MPPKGRNKAAVGYQHTAAVPAGTLLTSLNKKQWMLGKPVGQGGFGVLYLATPADEPKSDPLYVIKLEPHSNGPLFCEMHFYLRCAKPEFIKSWCSAKKKKSVGIPRYIGHGSHQHNGDNRFLVMDRFGADLQSLFVKAGKRFPKHTVYKVAIKMIDALEYIHSKEYTHADIKAANILLGYKTPDEVYLVDYGLAGRFMIDGKHQEYKPDPKSCHNGTIEFTSRDAHDGVPPSRRADMEILGYCLVQWLCSVLPWEDRLNNKDYVKTQKNKAMDDIPAFLTKCFGPDIPVEVQNYLEHVVSLGYSDCPDYDQLRTTFTNGLKKLGKLSAGLEFTAPVTNGTHVTSSSPESMRDTRSSLDDFSSPPPPGQKRGRKTASSSRKPLCDETNTPRGKRTKIKCEETPKEEDEDFPVKSRSRPRSRVKPELSLSGSPEISPQRSGSKVKRKVKVKTEVVSPDEESLGVTPLSPVMGLMRDQNVRRSPRTHVKRQTQDVYSPPAKKLSVPGKVRCKNPADKSTQTSPWLKPKKRKPKPKP